MEKGTTPTDEKRIFRTLFIVFILLIIVGAWYLIPGASIKTTTGEERTNITNLGDEWITSGQFTLGSGTVGTTPVYTFYYETGPDRYRNGWVDATISEIVTDEEGTPYLLKRVTCERTYMTTPGFRKDNWQMRYEQCTVGRVEIHVPKRTIIRDDGLDNEMRVV